MIKVIFATIIRIAVLSLLLVLSESGAGACQDKSPVKAITKVRIFDGEKIADADTVIIRGGKIEAVGKSLAVPEGAELIDGSGKTLLPGLIDSHVHVLSKDALRQCLVFGVTAVIDMFMDVKTMKEIKGLQAEKKAQDMAFLISAGTLATAPRSHGTQYLANIPTLSRPEDAPLFVENRVTEGSDFIKIILDDGSYFRSPGPSLSLETIRALIETAHERGKIAVVHAATLQNCLDVLNANADGLVHIYFDGAFDPDFGRIAAQHKAFVIPTLSVLEGMAGESGAPALAEDSHLNAFLKPQDIQNLKNAFPFKTGAASYLTAEKAVAQLKEAGVPLLAGTDAPNPTTVYGAGLHRELVLLTKAGLTLTEALRAATSLPAEKFGLAGRGRVKPGFVADLVLVDGDPTQNIEATRAIVNIWKEGAAVNRESYRELVTWEKKEIEKVKNSPPPENSESGWISDFEGEKIEARFGAGWMLSTDTMMGGKSTAEYKLTEGGAESSRKSLFISGKIEEGAAFRWAGAMFMPGKMPMTPANLSFKKGLSFQAKGQGKNFAVLVFTRSLGFIPAVQTFSVRPEWAEYVFPWEKFKLEGYDITGIFIGAYQEHGDFSLQIENVRLK